MLVLKILKNLTHYVFVHDLCQICFFIPLEICESRFFSDCTKTFLTGQITEISSTYKFPCIHAWPIIPPRRFHFPSPRSFCNAGMKLCSFYYFETNLIWWYLDNNFRNFSNVLKHSNLKVSEKPELHIQLYHFYGFIQQKKLG